MRKVSIGLFLFVLTLTVFGQTQEDNLKKYWKYRDRLRNKFMVVDQSVMDYGVNIPALEINYDDNKISWGDANGNMSHYLSVLATELWLLKHSHQDYSTTLKELYYAMLALERLDAYSESNFRWKKANGLWIDDDFGAKCFVQDGDINGFSLRNDVTPGFWSKHRNHFDVRDFSSNFSADNKAKFMEENSQDVIEHTMEGLALVSKLVGTELIASIPCHFDDIYVKPRLMNHGIMTCGSDLYQTPQSVNFSVWAQDFVKRFIDYMQYSGTFNSGLRIKNPIKASSNLSAFSTHWILHNPVTKTWVQEGSGSDGGVALISNGIIKTGEAITGENLRKHKGLVSDKTFNYAFRNPKLLRLFAKNWDDYKVRSLACNGNILGIKTFAVLRKLRDNYNPMKTGHFPIYEHFPLMYLSLQGLNYKTMGLEAAVCNSDKVLYEGLLNSAPVDGPASNCGVWDWTSTSRCIWPERLLKTPTATHIEYNGLDYMMLHNLYYIAFSKENFTTLKTLNAVDINIPVIVPSK